MTAVTQITTGQVPTPFEDGFIERNIDAAIGKLILLDYIEGRPHSRITKEVTLKTVFVIEKNNVCPIIISEIESIHLQDGVYYNSDTNAIEPIGPDIKWPPWAPGTTKNPFFRILAFPEDFARDHLIKIHKGEYKDGDLVAIECDYNQHLQDWAIKYPLTLHKMKP